MAKAKTPKEDTATPQPVVQVATDALAEAIARATSAAIEAARPSKKSINNRTRNTPWTPKDGSPKAKFKRKTYLHGILLSETMHSNEEINLYNKLRPGTFCDGFVKVVRRRDKGINMDYPVKTAAQRLRLVNQYGVRNLAELLMRCIDEAANPPKNVEDFDLD